MFPSLPFHVFFTRYTGPVWLSTLALCSAFCTCLIARRGSYAGLQSTQSNPNAALAGMPDLAILGNADLH